MNLPNKLTILRIILAFLFIFFVFAHGLFYKVLAFLVFLLASFTDALDGFIAKRNNQVTDFGKLMDPIADKILVLAAFIAFVELKIVPAWMVIIIILREIAVTALRALALTKGKVISADGGGKHKTVSQVVAIFAILIFIILREGGSKVFGFWNDNAAVFYQNAIYGLMCITIILTLSSGISYMIKNRSLISYAKTD